MKAPKDPIEKSKAPLFDEIIKYDHYGRKLQAKAIYSSFSNVKIFIKQKLLAFFSKDIN